MKRKILTTLVLVVYSFKIVYGLCRYNILRPALGADNAFLDITDYMRGWRGLPGMLARRWMLGLILGSAFGKHITVYNSLFSKVDISIGQNTYIGFDCNIGRVKIGRDVLISDSVMIMSGGHQHGTGNKDEPIRNQQGENIVVEIGDGAWIGAGTIVMANVGKGSVIGAGSVVTKPIPDYQTAYGIPAKMKKNKTC